MNYLSALIQHAPSVSTPSSPIKLPQKQTKTILEKESVHVMAPVFHFYTMNDLHDNGIYNYLSHFTVSSTTYMLAMSLYYRTAHPYIDRTLLAITCIYMADKLEDHQIHINDLLYLTQFKYNRTHIYYYERCIMKKTDGFVYL
jgi:hypothetical protein